MRQGRNKGSPLREGHLRERACAIGFACLAGVLLFGGCKANPTELRGKTSFGPEFRNRGNNTSEVRYDARQALELKWDNGWTTGISFRRRDVDDGSGDNETRGMVEIGYPLWKAPKKEEKTSMQIRELEEQVQEMRARVAELRGVPGGDAAPRLAQAKELSGQTMKD